jgi:hypothetical protein
MHVAENYNDNYKTACYTRSVLLIIGDDCFGML